MATADSYHKQMAVKNELKLRELRKDLPPFCDQFFRGIEPTTAPRTRIAYATDLKQFFVYAKNYIKKYLMSHYLINGLNQKKLQSSFILLV